MNNIWQNLKTPIFCLAPMFGATDSAFRQLLCAIGKPDIMFTEFTNVQAIFSPDTVSLVRQLKYKNKEKPLICQIWGLDPELFQAAAELIVDIGFDGVDINLGCPEKNVLKKGSGAALINNQPLVKKIIKATKKGTKGKIPVSAKIRLGLDKINTDSWIKFLLAQKLDALIVHGRTAKQMSKSKAHWDEIKKAVKIKNQLKSKTIIIGNGDIFSRKTAFEKIQYSGVEGVMIGRGVFHDPWIFNKNETIKTKTRQEKINTLLSHLKIYENTWGTKKPYHPLKRFYKIYLSGFPHALSLRTKLMETTNINQARKILK